MVFYQLGLHSNIHELLQHTSNYNWHVKILNYDIIHQIDYDCNIINFDEFEQNSELLETNDIVLYIERINENNSDI